ncbi:MAG: glycosyltransferase [Verrucomicrobia bacterium]|jgi:UDP-glucose:(heptosyl)LPS alpha-1,3-glucosyltransferase|nr:glycosyltransferase [Verrucomicrobiota bacterium]
MSTPIKIALVVKSLDPDKGGHENYIKRLLRGLLDKDYRVWCFAENFGSRSVEHGGLTKIRIRACKLESGLRMLWFNYRAQQLIRRHPVQFDLVFTTGNVTFGQFYRAGGGVHETYMENCLGSLEQLQPKHLVVKFLQRRLFTQKTPDRLITNSEMVRKDIQHRYGVSDRTIRVIRNGIDLDRFNPTRAGETRDSIRDKYGFSGDDFVCLFTAGGGKRKGLPELIHSFSLIKDTKVKLLIVGRTDASKLDHAITRYGLKHRVAYAGFQPQIEKFYGAADCLVFPSKYDAAANVVCEALASGLPVITTASNGSAELVESGKNGYVIPRAGDYDKIRACIEKLAGQENRSAMRQHAIATGQQFSMERHILEFEAALSDYLNNRIPNS